MTRQTYEEKLALEAEIWGSEAEQRASHTPPDWRYHRELRHNRLMHRQHIDDLLSRVRPGMKVLELGCSSGWLTLAAAQRGAEATGLDISPRSLQIGRDYYESIRETVSGSVSYQVTDLNTVELAPDTFDIVAVQGTLHHLVNLTHVIEEVYHALKPGGLFWISDTVREEARRTVLVASVFMFLLPTHVSYRDKLSGLLRFGLKSPSRIKASMEAEGLSPFEGLGREHDWLQLVQKRFTIERRTNSPAFTGYLTAQLNLPETLAVPLLKVIRWFDVWSVRLRLLPNSGVVICARKPEPPV